MDEDETVGADPGNVAVPVLVQHVVEAEHVMASVTGEGAVRRRQILRGMDLRHVRAFVAVVECGGFAAAAASLHLSQSAVSAST